MGIFAKLYKKMPFLDKRADFILNFKNEDLILDAGCGDVSFLKELLLINPSIKCIAIDKEDYSSSIPDEVEFKIVDLTKMPWPFQDQSIDGIILSHVFEHIISGHSKILHECYRILKPKGKIYIETPSTRSIYLPSLSSLKNNVGTLNFYDDPTHIRPYNKIALISLLRMAKYKILKVGFVRNLLWILFSPAILLFALLTRNKLLLARVIANMVGWSVFVVGEK